MYEKIEKKIGTLKFAVIIISLFSIFMIVGTFIESYYGTDFANRIIYKRWPFMLIQLSIFLSIFFAAMLRLPPKKRLYGFYRVVCWAHLFKWTIWDQNGNLLAAV